MKPLCVLPLAFILFFFTDTVAGQVISYTPVQMPPVYASDYYGLMDPKLLAEDMAALLSSATGEKYSTKIYDGPGKGIFLLLDSNLSLSSNESALVSSDGRSNLLIRAKYANGLSYAVYTYLDKLGFKFYLPGAAWSIIPKLKNIYPSVYNKEEWKPYFKNRVMGISGGLLPVKGMDDQGLNYREWNIWYRRNRMGSEFMGIGGHIGELFDLENRQAIEKDPAIIAPIDGRHVYGLSGKIDPTYTKGVNMFINWAVEKYRIENSNTPYFFPWHKYQSVDPGDGLNYCHTPACEAKFKSVSDQVFYIANEAAKNIRSKYPRAGVSLYAYTERADTPSVQLEPNVHVGIVSSAFQNVAMPAELVKRWAAKTSHISLYDYINIDVWSVENPFFNLDTYFAYLQWTKKLHTDGFTFEVGASKFGAGLQQYFILRYLNDPYNSIQDEFDQFCNTSFAGAAPVMKAMLKDWYFTNVHDGGYCFEDYEIGRFVKQMILADNTSTNNDTKKRLQELKAYLVLLAKKTNFESLETAARQVKDTSLKLRLATDMLTYTWQLYKTNIFHNSQFSSVMQNELRSDAAAYARWDQAKGLSPFNANIDEIIDREFSKLKEQYLPKAINGFTVNDAFLERAAMYSADTVQVKMVDAETLLSYTYYLDLYCTAPGKITVRYETGKSKLEKPMINQNGFVSVFSNDYNFMRTLSIPLKAATGLLSFDLPAKGHYQLVLAQQNSTPVTFTIQPGKNLLYINKLNLPNAFVLLRNENAAAGNSRLAFYVPEVNLFSYKYRFASCINTISLYNAAGQEVKPDFSKAPFEITYMPAATDRNNFMYFSNSLFRWPPRFKNILPYYFFLRYPLGK